MFPECSHSEAVKIVVEALNNYGYIVKTEAWFSTILGDISKCIDEREIEDAYRKFKFNVANAFLGYRSPWIGLHTPEFQTRLDVVGVYYGDCEGLPLYTFFVRKEPWEIALRTILVEVEHKHSIEKAVDRIKNFPAGKKVIVWTRGRFGGVLEGIPVVVARRYLSECDLDPRFIEILEEHINDVRGNLR